MTRHACISALILFLALTAAAPVAADCIEDGMDVELGGEALLQADGRWVLTLDVAQCLVIPADVVRADGSVRHRMLPGTYRTFEIDWGEAGAVAGAVTIAGTAWWRGEAAEAAGRPFGIMVRRVETPG